MNLLKVNNHFHWTAVEQDAKVGQSISDYIRSIFFQKIRKTSNTVC